MPSYIDDMRLAKALSKGDNRAFEQFFNLYFDRLFRFAQLRTDSDELQDILQNTMINALQKISDYRGEAALFTWLCQICRNELSSYFKKQARQAPMQTQDDHLRDILESIQAPLEGQPDSVAQRHQLLQLIRLTLDYLPARYGDVLEWKYILGWSTEEIAVALEQSADATQSMLQRARKAFKAQFETASASLLSEARS